jgi:hypothetical protein
LDLGFGEKSGELLSDDDTNLLKILFPLLFEIIPEAKFIIKNFTLSSNCMA